MILDLSMHQFMKDYVINHMLRYIHKLHIQVDIVFTRAFGRGYEDSRKAPCFRQQQNTFLTSLQGEDVNPCCVSNFSFASSFLDFLGRFSLKPNNRQIQRAKRFIERKR